MACTPYTLHQALAVTPGAMIGAERQWRQCMAGLRTGALVATGAAIFILSSMGTSSDSSGRNVAQIVCGIGFLGAGVIVRHGLNTAAALWCCACGRFTVPISPGPGMLA